jgi:hypothetical protein
MKSLLFQWLLALLTGALLPLFSTAQTLDWQVLGAAGGDASTPLGTWHSTLGETAVAPSSTPDNTYWGEGFQQVAFSVAVDASAPTLPAIPFTVYPNPATHTVFLKADQPLSVRLTDLAGRTITDAVTPALTHQIDLQRLPAGCYLLRVFSETGHLTGTVKVLHL